MPAKEHVQEISHGEPLPDVVPLSTNTAHVPAEAPLAPHPSGALTGGHWSIPAEFRDPELWLLCILALVLLLFA